MRASPAPARSPRSADDIKRLFDLGFHKIIVRYRGSNAADLTRQIDRFVTEIVPKA